MTAAMPPPKKPKTGRTSLEQFLSDEERQAIDLARRNSDGSGSPRSNDDDGSDGDVFESSSSKKSPLSESECDKVKNSLLQKLFNKCSRMNDEQKVPGSPDGEPTTPSDAQSEISFSGRGGKPGSTDLGAGEGPVRTKCLSKSSSGNRLSDPKLSETSMHSLNGDTGRLLDNLVAKALSSNAAQSIIHGQGPPTQSSLPQFGYSHPLPVVTNGNGTYGDSEPHDLSKRADDNKLLSPRLYDNINNTMNENMLRQYREWMTAGTPSDKPHLDTHKRIVGLLSDRGPRDITPVQIVEKENIVRPVPQHVNGFFHHLGLRGVGDLSRMEQLHRETLERAVGKTEDGCIVTQGGGTYLPVHSMIPTTSVVGQSPTSTTIDLSEPGDPFHHPALLNPHLTMATDMHRIKQNSSGASVNKLCQVCNDNASGFHYGVWSCEGCKAFFKRSIQGPVDYVCPATNTCTIDKHRRKSCQACRLRKCYEVGMNKGSQRKERKSSGQIAKAQKRPRTESDDNTINSTSGGSVPVKNPRKSQTTRILEALTRADMPHLESFHDHSLPPTRGHLLNSLVKLAERELVCLISWAKNVPGYGEISLGDQVHLIECCWMELLLLNCAFRSMEHRGRRLAFAPDLILERPFWSTVGMEDSLEQVAAVSEQMVQYNLHREELLLLQATILANAEVRRLASFNKLHEIQQTILDGLVDVAQKYHPDNLRHIPSVLLLLTHIRQAAQRTTAHFQALRKEGSVTFCDLLSEMLDAQAGEDRKPRVS